MAALSADVRCRIVGNNYIVDGFSANAADTFYKGAVVWIDAAGGVQATVADGDRILGISPKQQVIAAAGDLVEVVVFGLVWLPVGTNITAADEGSVCCNDASASQTDNPADLYAASAITLEAAKDSALGVIKRVTATEMQVLIGPFTSQVANAAGWGIG